MKEGNVMKKREGSALAFTIIIMVIITILSGIILQIAMAETMQAKRDKDRVEAYYLARSGVEATTKWILNSNNDASKIIDKQSAPQDLGNGKFNVEVLSTSNPDEIIVKGTGTVGKVLQESSVVLKRQTTLNKVSFKHAIYSTGELKIGGNSHISPSNSSIVSDVEVTVIGNEKKLGAKIYEPGVPGYNKEGYIAFSPKLIPTKGNNFSGSSLMFSDNNRNLLYDEFKTTLGNNDEFIVYTGNNTSYGDANLIVNRLDLGSHNHANIKISGVNRLNIYVIESANIGVNINQYGSADKLFISMGETSLMNMINNITFKGFIYGPNSNFNIHGGTTIEGGLIINTLDKMTGNINVIKKDIDINLDNGGAAQIHKYVIEKWVQ